MTNEAEMSPSRTSPYARHKRARELARRYILVIVALCLTYFVFIRGGAPDHSPEQLQKEAEADAEVEAEAEESDVTLHETTLSVSLSALGWSTCDVRALRCGKVGNPLVLLLHGARFTKETWKKIGTYPELCSKGFAAVGIDLPGYGETFECTADKAAFMNALLKTLAVSSNEKISIVSPSMSGAYTVAAVNEPSVAQRISSIVWVAPSATKSLEAYPSSIQTMIMYGSKDPIGSASVDRLSKFPQHIVTVLE